MKEDNHRHERAKKILVGRKKGGKAEMLKNFGKKGNGGLSGAEPKAQPVGGVKTKTRMDKPKRYATGGGVDDAPKKKSGAKTEVNIVIAGKGDQGGPQAVPVPIPAGGGAPVGAPPARPMPPPGGGMPPGMPMRPPGAMQRGGSVKSGYPIKAGSGSGEGRIEKAAAEKKQRRGKKDDE